MDRKAGEQINFGFVARTEEAAVYGRAEGIGHHAAGGERGASAALGADDFSRMLPVVLFVTILRIAATATATIATRKAPVAVPILAAAAAVAVVIVPSLVVTICQRTMTMTRLSY